MADISKCEGNNCAIRNTCYRYTCIGNVYRQSYIKPIYTLRTGCINYWEVKDDTVSSRKKL